MKAIDVEILAELETLPEVDKEQVLAFINDLKEGLALKQKDDGENHSVADDAGEYITPNKLLSQFKNLPNQFQKQLIQYLNTLKIQAEQEKVKSQTNFKPGFGGAKGLIVLKKGWDEPLTDLFEDYI